MRSNLRAVPAHRTYEGAPATIRTKNQLERLVACTMLFENTFYETGDTQAKNIAYECAKSDPKLIAEVAIKAREQFKLRHVPLFLLAQLAKRQDDSPPGLIKGAVAAVIKRPDECGELLKIMANDQKTTVKKAMTHAVQKGIAKAMLGFSEYQFAKWNRDSDVKLRDVLFLTHPRPSGGKFKIITGKSGKALRHSSGHGELFSKIASNSLGLAGTWEEELSAGKDKKEVWTRLLTERKLGYIALLMNLRNMAEAGVSRQLVEGAITAGATKSKALPFRFLSAERHAPDYSGVLSDALLSAVSEQKGSLPGDTIVMVDVSGSMFGRKISAKSQLDRFEAAAGMAILAKEVCQSSAVYTFSDRLEKVRNVRGIPLTKEMRDSQRHSGTMLRAAMNAMMAKERPDRVIIITDEESQDGIANLPCETWILNVASYKPILQVAGNVRRICGFSERILDFIKYEQGIEIKEEEAE